MLELYEEDVTYHQCEDTFEEWTGYTYEEYVEKWNAVAAQVEELETTYNDKPIFVVQEGTTRVAFGYDYAIDAYDYSLNDLVIFLPTTIVAVAEDYESCENITIYYAGDQADLASIVTTTSLLMVSAWKDYVICNTSYIGQ